MKNQKGVSVIELVIVIIVLLLITTFSVFSGRESIDQATATEIYAEINAIREAVNSVNIKKELIEDFKLESGDFYDIKISNIAKDAQEFNEKHNILVENSDFENLYLICGMDPYGMSGDVYKNSNVRKSYGLDSIKHTYLVNFEAGTVDLFESVEIANKNVRTFEQIRALVDDGEI